MFGGVWPYALGRRSCCSTAYIITNNRFFCFFFVSRVRAPAYVCTRAVRKILNWASWFSDRKKHIFVYVQNACICWYIRYRQSVFIFLFCHFIHLIKKLRSLRIFDNTNFTITFYFQQLFYEVFFKIFIFEMSGRLQRWYAYVLTVHKPYRKIVSSN